jgi:CheY-like chemotaxis protein
MDENTVRQIFEPFFTTKGVGEGTGLGLSTVYGIVKDHQGLITCYSHPGQGTTFVVYLPALRGDEELDPELDESGLDRDVQGGVETILVVDDEEIIRQVSEDMLSRFGYTVLLAASGEEALEIFQRESGRINLVITDLGMPGMGGEQCLKELLRIDPRVKVIVASGYAGHKLADDPARFGAAGFIKKPYRLNEMLQLVRAVLD